MMLYSIAIRDDGEVLTSQVAPHQGDDCDGLVYSARDEEGHDVFLFFISAFSQGEAVIMAREMFDGGEYVALDPMWQPGSVWPDTPDGNLHEQATVQIYSKELHSGYITTVPTHGRTHPFFDHIDDTIMWAYMRDIESRCIEEWKGDVERAKEYRRRQAEQQTSEVPKELEAVAEPTQQAKQLSFDFG